MSFAPDRWHDTIVKADRNRPGYHKSLSFSGSGGSSGDDSVLIGYDAVLACKGSWEQASVYK